MWCSLLYRNLRTMYVDGTVNYTIVATFHYHVYLSELNYLTADLNSLYVSPIQASYLICEKRS